MKYIFLRRKVANKSHQYTLNFKKLQGIRES